MMITRKLAHKVHNQLQQIMSAVELGHTESAMKKIHALASLVSAHVESKEDEQARVLREESDS